MFWGNQDVFPHNGWAVPGGFLHRNVWKLYNVAFGDYMLPDAQGLQLLNEIFVSPGEFSLVPVASNYEALKTDPEIMFPDDFRANNDFAPNAIWPSEDEDEFNSIFAAPSYRYTVTAIMGNHEITGEDFWGGVSVGPFEGGAETAGWAQPNWNIYRAFVQADSYRHPSKKVMFYNMFASHNRNARWYTHAGPVQIPVNFVDGHAETVSPANDIPGPTTEEWREILDSGDFVGVSQDYTWFANGPPGSLPIPADDGRSAPWAWFAATIGGTAGRDFR